MCVCICVFFYPRCEKFNILEKVNLQYECFSHSQIQAGFRKSMGSACLQHNIICKSLQCILQNFLGLFNLYKSPIWNENIKSNGCIIFAKTHDFLLKDMTSRDLVQQRVTNAEGDTSWQFSPLITAALNGKMALLDGIHRLHHGTLALLHRWVG